MRLKDETREGKAKNPGPATSFGPFLVTPSEAYPRTPPPGNQRFPPKCVTKPELRYEEPGDAIPGLNITIRVWNLRN